jgi:predicted MFS family arabinose efflux permease
MMALSDAVPAAMKRSASAVFYVSWGLGYFLVPPALSALGDAIGLRAVFFLVGAAALAEFAVVRKKRRQAGTSETERI